MKKTAIITGATAGIGRATAILLAENNYNVVITGRREERLNELKSEIKQKSDVKVFISCFDIRKENEVKNAVKNISKEFDNKIDILVNNAGLASGLDPISKGSTEDWNKMIDTNIKGLLFITRYISPLMEERKSGHIINIGSIAGKEVYPNGNVYCATKHAVEALTKGMRIDLLTSGVKVTAVCPGLVETEFSEVRFHGDKERAKEVYTGYKALEAKDIAEAVLFAVTRPAHVNINDMLVMPAVQASATIIDKE